MPKHYNPAHGVSLEDLNKLDQIAAELHAFAEAMQSGCLGPEAVQAFGSMTFDRALGLEEISENVTATKLRDKAPLCFNEDEALQLERFITLLWGFSELRDIPESIDLSGLDHFWRTICERNRRAGLYKPTQAPHIADAVRGDE